VGIKIIDFQVFVFNLVEDHVSRSERVSIGGIAKSPTDSGKGKDYSGEELQAMYNKGN